MRALSGAIITAAALIGLGLTAQGLGTRYEHFIIWRGASGEETSSPSLRTEPDFDKSKIKISELDNPMKLCLTLLVLSVLIGLGITFVGLMYHHHRRFHEHLRAHGHPAPTSSSHITT
ncbi:MAG TPA: hypothetical protein VH643_22730 [Gemmataceae bacterium]|jgi:hypothetical protein